VDKQDGRDGQGEVDGVVFLVKLVGLEYLDKQDGRDGQVGLVSLDGLEYLVRLVGQD